MPHKDRIREFKRVPASELIHNPRNWRTHPPEQRQALEGILEEVGYADALIVRETDAGLEIINGHLRAETTPDAVVPVLVLDVSEEEANKLLVTFDPLSQMAGTDDYALASLLEDLDFESDNLKSLLSDLSPDEWLTDLSDSLVFDDDAEIPDPMEHMALRYSTSISVEVRNKVTEALAGLDVEVADINGMYAKMKN